MRSLSRRGFLRGVGLSPAFLPLLDASRVGAASPPKRLVVVTKPNGTPGELFWPQVNPDNPAYPAGPLSGLTLPEITQVLEPHKADLIFVRGMTFVTQTRMTYDAHQTCLSLLTGQTDTSQNGVPEESRSGTGISVDQWISNQINSTTLLQVPLLNVGVAAKSSSFCWTSFRAAKQPNSPENNPYTLFDKIFGSQSLSSADLDRIRAERKSVLDYLQPALATFSARMGTQDKAKVDSHLQAIRSLEAQLSVPGSIVVPPKLGQPLDVDLDANIPAVANAQMDLVVAALASDVTRVVTFDLMDGLGDHTMSWLGTEFTIPNGDAAFSANGLETYHTISHHDEAYNGQRKIAAEKWFMGQLALLLDKMKAVKEGGGTLLDNSLVVFVDQLSWGGNHTFNNLPIILAGSCGGYFSTGRMVDFNKAGVDAPHNGLLCAMANAMGFPRSTFGDTDLGGEPAGLKS